MFKLEDIKAGYLLEVEKDGKTDLCIVQYNDYDDLGISSKNTWGTLSCFNENLTCSGTKITKIYGRTHNWGMSRSSTDDRKLLWSRDDAKEMTVSEIEKVLGYKVKIVK